MARDHRAIGVSTKVVRAALRDDKLPVPYVHCEFRKDLPLHFTEVGQRYSYYHVGLVPGTKWSKPRTLVHLTLEDILQYGKYTKVGTPTGSETGNIYHVSRLMHNELWLGAYSTKEMVMNDSMSTRRVALHLLSCCEEVCCSNPKTGVVYQF